MSSETEMQILSNSNEEIAKKNVLPDKYLKQMVFGYWLNAQCIEKNTSVLETLRLYDTIHDQKEFYDIFDKDFKSIKSAMMDEIKSKIKKEDGDIKKEKGGKPKKVAKPVEKEVEKVEKVEKAKKVEKVEKEKVEKAGKEKVEKDLHFSFGRHCYNLI